MPNTKKELNPDMVYKLAQIGCTNQEIADIVGVSHDTLTRRCKAELEEGRAFGRMSLRRKQWDVALAGNVTMLIWLGKQQLGQSDKQEVKSETTERIIKFNWGGASHSVQNAEESSDGQAD